MIKAVLFDMFDTLADAHRSMEQAECDALAISREQWSKAMWEKSLTYDRGTGNIKTVREIIDRAFGNLTVETTPAQRTAAEKARCERLRMAMTDMDPQIVETIRTLKDMRMKVGLVSNADVCDRKYWKESPIFPFFDDAIFSCDVGLLKPDPEIYERALSNLGVSPEEAVFIGDGGSRELAGAKALGMKTVCTEYLRIHDENERRDIHQSADWVVLRFDTLKDIVQKEIWKNEELNENGEGA